MSKFATCGLTFAALIYVVAARNPHGSSDVGQEPRAFLATVLNRPHTTPRNPDVRVKGYNNATFCVRQELTPFRTGATNATRFSGATNVLYDCRDTTQQFPLIYATRSCYVNVPQQRICNEWFYKDPSLSGSLYFAYVGVGSNAYSLNEDVIYSSHPFPPVPAIELIYFTGGLTGILSSFNSTYTILYKGPIIDNLYDRANPAFNVY